MATRALLDARAPALREAAGERRLADCRAGPPSDRGALRDRGIGPCPCPRDPARRAHEARCADHRRLPALARGAALAHPKSSKLAEDIRYTLGIWPGLTRFLEDGRLELDANPVENQIRPIALTRKNALFAGHEIGAGNWATLASLVATCKMSNVNPITYLAATLRSLLDGHPKSRIENLMPWTAPDATRVAA
jgi:hypothetical protein